MSASGEVEAPALEQQTVEVPPTEEPKKEASKPVKERKPKLPKEKKPKQPKAAAHPPYFQMIKDALLALNERSGSSPYAIAKYMEEKHKDELPANYKKMLALQLKNSVVKGNLIKIKASYKLSEMGKRDKVAKANAEKKPKPKPRQAKPTPKKPETPVKKAVKKRSVKRVGPAPKKAKKSTPAKPKQPKSIKSPAAKRARKATA